MNSGSNLGRIWQSCGPQTTYQITVGLGQRTVGFGEHNFKYKLLFGQPLLEKLVYFLHQYPVTLIRTMEIVAIIVVI